MVPHPRRAARRWAWRCRGPCRDTRAWSRRSRSRRPSDAASSIATSVLPEAVGPTSASSDPCGHVPALQTRNGSEPGSRHDLAREVMRRGRPDARERTKVPGASGSRTMHDPVRARTCLGREALLVRRPPRAPPPCGRPARANARATSAPAAPRAARSVPARPPWGPGRRTTRPACPDAASTGT